MKGGADAMRHDVGAGRSSAKRQSVNRSMRLLREVGTRLGRPFAAGKGSTKYLSSGSISDGSLEQTASLILAVRIPPTYAD